MSSTIWRWANRLVDLQDHLHLQEDPKEVSHRTLGIHHILTSIHILISFSNPQLGTPILMLPNLTNLQEKIVSSFDLSLQAVSLLSTINLENSRQINRVWLMPHHIFQTSP